LGASNASKSNSSVNFLKQYSSIQNPSQLNYHKKITSYENKTKSIVRKKSLQSSMKGKAS
jgi:hypothetical protein